jgi:two-component system chemotaxis sensor kinase CheA
MWPSAPLTESDERRKCLLVDDLIGKQEVVIKSLGERLKKVKGLAGCAILADGRVGLILDVPGLFELSEKSSQGV